MNWILIGTIANTLLAQPFESREACEGRAVVVREAKAIVKCVEMPSNASGFITYGTPINPVGRYDRTSWMLGGNEAQTHA